jgi:peptide chain release factor subunit 1
LKNTKFVEEQKILQSFFDQIVIDGAYCYSSTLSINSLEQGLIEKLIVWDELPDIRYELVSMNDPTIKKIIFRSPAQDYNEKTTTTVESISFPGYEIISSMPLLDWIFEHYKEFGSKIELVSNSSSIGNQFIKGFGGIGGFLRFKLVNNEEELNPNGSSEDLFGDDDEEDDEESEYDYEY